MKEEIKKFKRVELKYLITLEQKEKLLKELDNKIAPDTNGNLDGKYKLESLYYDTDDLKFYFEKADGVRFRKKLRLRRYVEKDKKFDENSKVFIEIKEKVNEITEKRRVKMTYKDAKNLIEKNILPKHKKEDDYSIINEIYLLSKENILKPKAITTYDRQAFFGLDKTDGLRLTFDREVFYKSKNLELNSEKLKDGDIIEKNFTILEIKANDKIPDFILQFLEKNNIFPQKLSKYCLAIESFEEKLLPKTNLDSYNFSSIENKNFTLIN